MIPEDYTTFLPSFTILEPIVECFQGDIAEAVSEMICLTFFVDSEVSITECGPAICAIADVFAMYLQWYPKHPSLTIGVTVLFANFPIHGNFILATHHGRQTLLFCMSL
jgi:hypothetical protein